MNSQNTLIQYSLNQMIFIHTILDTNLFYINYQHKQARGQLCIRYYISEILTKNTWMYTWKANDSFIKYFFQIIWKIAIPRIKMKIVWLLIVIFAKN